jgi:hypothetical protein
VVLRTTRYGVRMTLDPDILGVPIDHGAPSQHPPEPLRSYLASYADVDYLKRSGPLTLLRLGRVTQEALHRYESALVAAARKAAIPDSDIARALETNRQNIGRRFGRRGEL